MQVVLWLGLVAVVVGCVSAPVKERDADDAGGEALERDAGPSKPPTRPPRADSGGEPRPPPVTRTWDAAAAGPHGGESAMSGGGTAARGMAAGRGGSAGTGGAGAAGAARSRGSGAAPRGNGARPGQSGALVITEVMVDPKATPDASGEWFELHNPGAAALDLAGCSIADGSAQNHALIDAASVPSAGFATIARSEGAGFSPSSVASFSLKNGADVLALECDGVVIDRVEYDENLGFPIAAGIAMSLDRRYLDAESNDSAGAWCRASRVYSTDLGSPGEANPPCGGDDDAGSSD